MAKAVHRRPGQTARPAATSTEPKRSHHAAKAAATEPVQPTDPSDPPGGRGGPETPLQRGDRPQAREGLKPIGDERAHPSAAARPGKSSGSTLGTPEAEPPTVEEMRALANRPKLKVRAIAVGYYDHTRRRVGDVFVIDGTMGDVPKRTARGALVKDRNGNVQYEPGVLAFSSAWMERVDAKTKEHTTTPNEAIRREHDKILAGKRQSGLQTGPDDVGEVPTGTHNPLGE